MRCLRRELVGQRSERHPRQHCTQSGSTIQGCKARAMRDMAISRAPIPEKSVHNATPDCNARTRVSKRCRPKMATSLSLPTFAGPNPKCPALILDQGATTHSGGPLLQLYQHVCNGLLPNHFYINVHVWNRLCQRNLCRHQLGW